MNGARGITWSRTLDQIHGRRSWGSFYPARSLNSLRRPEDGTGMANFKGHMATAAGLGLAYGSFAFWQMRLELGPALLGAGLTTVGGLLPDLDSDKSVPNRTLFRLLGVAV